METIICKNVEMLHMVRFESLKHTKLNLKDKQLLAELDFGARQSLASLAKKLGMSKRGVEYKIKRLEKEKVILGYYPVINMPRLGYLYCRCTFSLRNASPKKEAEIFSYLTNLPQSFWVFRLQGVADVGVAMWVNSVQEFKDVTNELVGKFGEFILNKNESITCDVIHYSHRYLLGTQETNEIHIAETTERITIDDLDKSILRVLSKNARVPTMTIAEQVGASPRVVSYRIKAMEKNGVIEAYRVRVDHKRLGFVWYKLWVDSTHKHDSLVSFVKQNPATVYVVEGSGMLADLDVEIVVKDALDIYKFVNDLRAAFPGEIGAYSSVILEEVRKVNDFSLGAKSKS